MRVFLRPYPTALSRALTRVADALEQHAPPGVTIVARREEADLVIHHVIGKGSLADIQADVDAGRRYAMIQYCVKSSDMPEPLDWLPYWQRAALTWSYYDLAQWDEYGDNTFNFYHAPLGVDRSVFKLPVPQPERDYLLATTGYVAESESLRECAEAVKRAGGRMIHLGPKTLNLGAHVDYALGITDAEWAALLGRSRFVAGLRRIEGFEFPVIEGLACGAWPIVFDQPHYRQWFGHFAHTVPEGDAGAVTHALETIFRAGCCGEVPTTGAIDGYLERFDWPTICAGFWGRLTGDPSVG